ncbi:hypothetical protein [Halogeometricum luteum]|uniref:Uncharacterized protein n=1 Tax=Halogeometricum luteum TaxID=2950537 RepID=A0ABU2G4L2_9EURY|nr:hypothetical protein [Halogeometricum sp. S3BR5-2]MDS0295736.1 hypothetical protein [Halogeometricum sp. S3BR5-2]
MSGSSWSWEEFWDVMESFSFLWFGIAVADLLFGLLAIVALAVASLDPSDPGYVVVVLDLVLVVVTLIPVSFVLYRLRQREIERAERQSWDKR